MDTGDSPGHRLAEFRKQKRLSQRALSQQLGFSGGRVSQIESGYSTPSHDFLSALTNTYGVSADWLLHGVGDMLIPHGAGFGGKTGQARIEPPDLGKPLHGAFIMDGVEYVSVRRCDLDVSAGNGLGPAEDGPSDAIAMPREWMMRHRLAADLCVLVRVRGDSMSPGIADGAFLLLNAQERHSYAPGIYAFTLRGEAFAKRLAVTAKDPSGRPSALVLISDNPAYAPISLAGSELDDLKIVGRVRGVFAFL